MSHHARHDAFHERLRPCTLQYLNTIHSPHRSPDWPIVLPVLTRFVEFLDVLGDLLRFPHHLLLTGELLVQVDGQWARTVVVGEIRGVGTLYLLRPRSWTWRLHTVWLKINRSCVFNEKLVREMKIYNYKT